jgi:hypothetical protein
MSSRSATTEAMFADDFAEREIGIVQRALRVDDGLFGGIVERLRLLDVAARTDAGLLARLGLIQQRAEGIALAAVGGQLIRGR